MDLLFYILFGAGVGLAVGLTGVGGGSLMTPLLILFGVPEKIAIGTDLLYASATKMGAMHAHQKQGTIRWRLVLLLASTSIPASIATSLILKYFFSPDEDYSALFSTTLGGMLVLTSIVIFFKSRQREKGTSDTPFAQWVQRNATPVTLVSGFVLGTLVTLSSVGAGAFCAALLLTLYPRLPAIQVVGTDIAHAVPLTLFAGLGHLANDNIDFTLLFGLLIGSLPAVHLGAKIAVKVPNSVLQPILAALLMVIGINFLFFQSL